MASFLITEAEVEDHKERTKHKRHTIHDSEEEEEDNDQPTPDDLAFINDGDPDEDVNPNKSDGLENMERQLQEETNTRKKRGRPPSNETTAKRVYI